MTGLSDAVVIGTVLSLVFAAVAYYLYSRIVQVEGKLGLMENILLDLKVTTEQALLSSPSTDEIHQHQSSEFVREVQFEPEQSSRKASSRNESSELIVEREHAHAHEEVARQEEVAPVAPSQPSFQAPQEPTTNLVAPNFESMTYKELVVEARKYKITGYSHMSKSALCEALRKQLSTATGSEETVSLTNWTLDAVNGNSGSDLVVEKMSSSASSSEPVAALSLLEDNGVATLESMGAPQSLVA